MEDEKERDSNSWLVQALIGCSIVAILVSFYFFYYKKDYNFIVEVPCNTLQETCFQRDCSSLGDCPPNNLSVFKRYSLNANDFKACENEDCTNACEGGEIKCELIKCTENLEVGESCSSLKNPVNNE